MHCGGGRGTARGLGHEGRAKKGRNKCVCNDFFLLFFFFSVVLSSFFAAVRTGEERKKQRSKDVEKGLLRRRWIWFGMEGREVCDCQEGNLGRIRLANAGGRTPNESEGRRAKRKWADRQTGLKDVIKLKFSQSNLQLLLTDVNL